MRIQRLSWAGLAITEGRSETRRQAYVLLLLGLVFLIVAWLGLFNSYSVGVLLFGLGMLGVAPLNPRRFLSAGWLTTTLGVATFLMFRQYIPTSQIIAAHILAIGLGLLGIAWMAHRGYIGTGVLTPGLFVVGLGIVISSALQQRPQRGQPGQAETEPARNELVRIGQ